MSRFTWRHTHFLADNCKSSIAATTVLFLAVWSVLPCMPAHMYKEFRVPLYACRSIHMHCCRSIHMHCCSNAALLAKTWMVELQHVEISVPARLESAQQFESVCNYRPLTGSASALLCHLAVKRSCLIVVYCSKELAANWTEPHQATAVYVATLCLACSVTSLCLDWS